MYLSNICPRRVSFLFFMCCAHQEKNTWFWYIRKIRKYSSYFPKNSYIFELVTLWPRFLHLEAVNGSVFVSICQVPAWKEKVKLAKTVLPFPKYNTKVRPWEKHWYCCLFLGEESGIPWISLSSSCPSWTFYCCLSEKAVFSETLVSSEVNFKEWASALLPRSGWASCRCSENRQIYPLVGLKAEKVTVNTCTFLLSSLINHSMGFTSPAS